MDSPPAAAAKPGSAFNQKAGGPLLAAAGTDPTAQPARIVIYSAGIRVVVQDVRQTIEAVQSQAKSLGGYLQEMDGDSVTVRVPAGRFDSLLAQIDRLGEITQRQIKAQDITEEMRDLNIRLDNAEKVRQRLVTLLEKSQKMEDTLQIEKELARLTETIEMLKGKIRFMESHAAFSTVKVWVNSPLPQKDLVEQIPFPWVRDLGNGLLSGRVMPAAERSGWYKTTTNFALPPAYIRYFENKERTEAMNANSMLIKLQRHDNYEGGDLAFWSQLVRKAMVDNRGLAVSDERDLKLDRGPVARVITGTRDVAGKSYGYLVAVTLNDKRVYTFEAWGPAPQFKNDLEPLYRSIQTLDVGK